EDPPAPLAPPDEPVARPHPEGPVAVAGDGPHLAQGRADRVAVAPDRAAVDAQDVAVGRGPDHSLIVAGDGPHLAEPLTGERGVEGVVREHPGAQVVQAVAGPDPEAPV